MLLCVRVNVRACDFKTAPSVPNDLQRHGFNNDCHSKLV